MSARFIVILLALAALLTGALLWLGRAQPAAAAARPLIEGMDPLKVDRITVKWAQDGSLGAEVARLPTGTWIMRWREGDVEASWPAISSRIMGAIRLLSAVKAAPGTSLELGGDQVWITMSAGPEPIELRAAKRSFGGKGVLIRETHPSAHAPNGPDPLGPLAAEVESEMVQIFQRADVLAWRDMSVFPLETTNASRISITGAGGVARAARVGARWAIHEPGEAPADLAQVQGLLAALKKLRIVRFADPSSLGWQRVPDDQLRGLIVLETDRRTPDGDPTRRTVLRQELRIGAAAGVDGSLPLPQEGTSSQDSPKEAPVVGSVEVSVVHASGEVEPLWGPTPLMLDGPTARDVLRPAPALVSRLATPVVAADVRGLEIGDPAFFAAVRQLDLWKPRQGGELSLVQREAIRTLIELITSAAADRTEFATETLAARAASGIRVVLLGAEGPPLDQVWVRVRDVAAGLPAREVVISSGAVDRVYGGDAAATWEQAQSQLR